MAAALVALGAAPLPAAEAVSFRTDVMAVLSKGGCNQGTCHGNQNGKNGFKLSLRGENPAADWLSLTRDQFSRRVDSLDPASSLLVEKATGRLPHGGGRRFEPGSLEYQTLCDWIGQGADDDAAAAPRVVRLEVSPAEVWLTEPRHSCQIRIRATFSDATTRDVTRWSVYTPSVSTVRVNETGEVSAERPGEATIVVRYLDQQATVAFAIIPERPGFVWQAPPEANYIDAHVFAKLRRLRINPSPLASDVVFLRRAYADLLGVLPTAEEAKAFVKDPAADKRARLVDRLLERPEFADLWALKWSDLLRNEEKALDRKGVQAFHHWIRQSIAKNKPLDRFVRELVAARGSTYQNPPANYYRANRDPVTRAEATAQLFLGVRLQCAKCHNHPFDRWTQDDYYNWADLFARVRYKVIELRKRDELDRHEFDGEQIVWMARRGDVKNPRTSEPAEPRVLGEAARELAPGQDRLEYLANWLTSPDNPLFARVQANRIWFQLMGRGIVEPIDDFRATNPAVNGPLLDALAADFVSHGYDLRHLLGTIMRSATYQLSSVPNETNADDETNFSHVLVRPIPAEQLLDALHRVTGASTKFSGYPRGLRAGQLPGVASTSRRRKGSELDAQFLENFGKPARLLTCECERSSEATLAQAFQLISGPAINEQLRRQDNRLDRWLASGKTGRETVADVYWTALSRAPAPDEHLRLATYLDAANDRRAALEDIVWAVLNAKEFILRD